MKKVLAGLTMALLSIVALKAPMAKANQAPQPAFCAPVYLPTFQGAIQSSPLAAELAHAESCGAQAGDLLSDGPLYTVQPTFSSTSFLFNTPGMTWIVLGQRIYVPLQSQTVGASTTTCFYIDSVTAAWSQNVSCMPPTSTSILGYTVATNGSGITAITPAATSGMAVNSVSASQVTQAGSNVQPSANCFICYGAAGSMSSNAFAFGNAVSAGVSYTAIGAPNNTSVAGVPNSVFEVSNSGTHLLAIDQAGNLGVSGNVEALGFGAFGQLGQQAANDFAGQCTNSSGTTCTATLAKSYSSPLCFAIDTSSTNLVHATCAASGTSLTVTIGGANVFGTCSMVSSTLCSVTLPYGFASSACRAAPTSATTAVAAQCSVSGTTASVMASGSNSLTWTVVVDGVPSATGHSFSFMVLGDPN